MVSFKSAFIAAVQIAATAAVDISVESSGGNATGKYHYGFLHEVCIHLHLQCFTY